MPGFFSFFSSFMLPFMVNKDEYKYKVVLSRSVCVCQQNAFLFCEMSISQDYWGDIKVDWVFFVKLHIIFVLKYYKQQLLSL